MKWIGIATFLLWIIVYILLHIRTHGSPGSDAENENTETAVLRTVTVTETESEETSLSQLRYHRLDPLSSIFIKHNSSIGSELSSEITDTIIQHTNLNKSIEATSNNSTNNDPTASISISSKLNMRGSVTATNFIGGTISAAIKSKNLILGLAFNTDEKYFAVFAGSLRAYARSAHAVVFVNIPVSKKLLEIAEETGIEIIGTDVSTLEPEYLRRYHPSSLRWELFYRYLKENDRYLTLENIWMNDVRDTVFQTDPFEMFSAASDPDQKEAFHVYQEAGVNRIGDCGWNSGWVRDCFDRTTYERVFPKPIICSGASSGRVKSVLKYLEIMHKLLTGQEIGIDNPGSQPMVRHNFPKCERNGVDQGAHNVIVHMGLVPGTVVHTEREGSAVHLQSAEGVVRVYGNPLRVYAPLGKENKPFAVVHQYDRNYPLMKGLAAEYVRWVDISDPEREWNNEPSCKLYTRAKGVDVFRGVGDVKMVRIMSVGSCCSVCSQMREDYAKDPLSSTNCNAFAFTEGECFIKSCSQIEINSRDRGTYRSTSQDHIKGFSAYLTPRK